MKDIAVVKKNKVKWFFWRVFTVIGFIPLLFWDIVLKILFYVLAERINHWRFMEKGFDEFDTKRNDITP